MKISNIQNLSMPQKALNAVQTPVLRTKEIQNDVFINSKKEGTLSFCGLFNKNPLQQAIAQSGLPRKVQGKLTKLVSFEQMAATKIANAPAEKIAGSTDPEKLRLAQSAKDFFKSCGSFFERGEISDKMTDSAQGFIREAYAATPADDKIGLELIGFVEKAFGAMQTPDLTEKEAIGILQSGQKIFEEVSGDISKKDIKKFFKSL